MRKSISQRIKITKTGKILRRPMAQDHFRAKKSRQRLYRKSLTRQLLGKLAKRFIQYGAR